MLWILHALAAQIHIRYERAGPDDEMNNKTWPQRVQVTFYSASIVRFPCTFFYIVCLCVCVSFFVDDFTLSTAYKIHIHVCDRAVHSTLTGRQKYAKGRINIIVDIFIDCGLFGASCEFEYLLNVMRHRDRPSQINQFDISANQRKKFK